MEWASKRAIISQVVLYGNISKVGRAGQPAEAVLCLAHVHACVSLQMSRRVANSEHTRLGGVEVLPHVKAAEILPHTIITALHNIVPHACKHA